MDQEFPEIFVGRHSELKRLDHLWNKTLKAGEHFAYVYFNAPGIGKTTLLKKFGEILEREGRGITFAYYCSNEFTSREALIEDLIESLSNKIRNSVMLINSFIENNYNDEYLLRTNKKQFQNLLNIIDESINIDKIDITSFTRIIKKLSYIIPVFYISDEVQVFEQISLGDETLFHHYTRIIKAFMASRILLVLSGTQYHILRQIGVGIGSPIREKVHSRIISPFSQQDIIDYCDKLREFIYTDISDKLWQYLERYLQIYSGGHPRTIVRIAKHFLSISASLINVKDYEQFTDEIDLFRLHFIDQIIRSDQRDALLELQNSEQFSNVKDWLLSAVQNNMMLDRRPRDGRFEIDIEIERIVFYLMTTGIIVQNGDERYYLTSYFHLLLFLELYRTEHDQFLSEVLNNRFFHKLVGGHSGLGYSFENILLSSLIVRNYSVDGNSPFQIKDVIRTRAIPDRIEQDIMYHTPDMKSFDAFVLNGYELTIIQITTLKAVNKNKIVEFEREIDILRDKYSEYKITALFFSLYNTSYSSDTKIIAGDQLIDILGEGIYKRVLNTKRQLRY